MWTKTKETTDSKNGSMGALDFGVNRYRLKNNYYVQEEKIQVWEIWQWIEISKNRTR